MRPLSSPSMRVNCGRKGRNAATCKASTANRPCRAPSRRDGSATLRARRCRPSCCNPASRARPSAPCSTVTARDSQVNEADSPSGWNCVIAPPGLVSCASACSAASGDQAIETSACSGPRASTCCGNTASTSARSPVSWPVKPPVAPSAMSARHNSLSGNNQQCALTLPPACVKRASIGIPSDSGPRGVANSVGGTVNCQPSSTAVAATSSSPVMSPVMLRPSSADSGPPVNLSPKPSSVTPANSTWSRRNWPSPRRLAPRFSPRSMLPSSTPRSARRLFQ